MTDVEGVVQSNLDAYNQRDIDQFMAVVSDEISLFTFGESQPSLVGKKAIRDFYATLFENSPELHSIILSRIVIGNKVIDHESITGRTNRRLARHGRANLEPALTFLRGSSVGITGCG